MSADTDAILRGHLNVIDRRMDQLQEAIRGRDWDATEYR
jgi:hypothetical protein